MSCDHLLGLRIIPQVELFGQFEQPGPAIGALEGAAVGTVEVGTFGLQVLAE